MQLSDFDTFDTQVTAELASLRKELENLRKREKEILEREKTLVEYERISKDLRNMFTKGELSDDYFSLDKSYSSTTVTEFCQDMLGKTPADLRVIGRWILITF